MKELMSDSDKLKKKIMSDESFLMMYSDALLTSGKGWTVGNIDNFLPSRWD
jgi:hypothetical protein